MSIWTYVEKCCVCLRARKTRRTPERVISGPQQEQSEGALGGRVPTPVCVGGAFAGAARGRIGRPGLSLLSE